MTIKPFASPIFNIENHEGLIQAKIASRYSVFFRITLHDSVRLDLEVVPSLIGSSASANALAYYLMHYEDLSGDYELANFMRFYAAHHMKSKSQWSQDIWVMYESRNSTNKSYLEIGGADGYTHSNTLSLEMYLGWSGTLVEPERHQFNILKIARRNNNLLNRALSPDGIYEKDFKVGLFIIKRI